MRKLNIIHVAVNSSIKWQCIEEIRFTQFGYCLTISYGRMAKTPSYLYDTTIQDGIDYIRFGHFCCAGSFLHQKGSTSSHLWWLCPGLNSGSNGGAVQHCHTKNICSSSHTFSRLLTNFFCFLFHQESKHITSCSV